MGSKITAVTLLAVPIALLAAKGAAEAQGTNASLTHFSHVATRFDATQIGRAHV